MTQRIAVRCSTGVGVPPTPGTRAPSSANHAFLANQLRIVNYPARIEERIKKLRQVAQSLDQFLASEKEIKMLTAQKSFVCQEKTVEPMLIAA